MTTFEFILLIVVVFAFGAAVKFAKRKFFDNYQATAVKYMTQTGSQERDSINDRYKVAVFSKVLMIVMIVAYLGLVALMLIGKPSVATLAVALFLCLPFGLAYVVIFAAYIFFVHLVLARLQR